MMPRDEDAVLARARDVHHRHVARPHAAEIAGDPLAHVDVVEAGIWRPVAPFDLALAYDHERPLRAAAVQHEVIDAVHPQERREVIAAVGIEDDARFGRPRRAVAARARSARCPSARLSRRSVECRYEAGRAIHRAGDRDRTCWRRVPRAAVSRMRRGVYPDCTSRVARSTNSVRPCAGSRGSCGSSDTRRATRSRMPMSAV